MSARVCPSFPPETCSRYVKKSLQLVGLVLPVISNDFLLFFSPGMAEQLGHFLGPPGFAAACAASALVGVSSLALLRRRCGCPGAGVGMICILKPTLERTDVPSTLEFFPWVYWIQSGLSNKW